MSSAVLRLIAIFTAIELLVVGGLVALLDSVAWASFGGFGPQPTVPDMTLAQKIGTVALVTITGIACGLLGAWLSRRLAPSLP